MTDSRSDEVSATLRKVWEEHTDESYRRDQSHWKGQGRWSDEKWEAVGQGTVKRLTRIFGPHRPHPWLRAAPVVLEWGPGGGSNLHALAPHATVLYGVDISQQNLQETERVLRMQHPQVDFHAILLRENPAEVLERVLQPVDIFVSTAVFQHFPSQQYGADVLNVVGRLCAKGCVGLIQIRFDNGNPKYTSKDFAEYERLHITATSYELSAFWDLCRAAGLRPVSIFDINTTNNYAYVAFTKG
ncbi:MAG: class I SAM-dependent methyltransferase [Euzebyales bacterium]|jgi:hypothetical protein|nr:class I SAM-dependent methyltransferase [Euzebyales bacterium]